MLSKWLPKHSYVAGHYLLLTTEISGRKVLNWLRQVGKPRDPILFVLALISSFLYLIMLWGATYGLWRFMTQPV
ncbi:hypothetical protein D3C85_1487280 [compost metagenome]